jgi:hypothetical protein
LEYALDKFNTPFDYKNFTWSGKPIWNPLERNNGIWS